MIKEPTEELKPLMYSSRLDQPVDSWTRRNVKGETFH